MPNFFRDAKVKDLGQPQDFFRGSELDQTFSGRNSEVRGYGDLVQCVTYIKSIQNG